MKSIETDKSNKPSVVTKTNSWVFIKKAGVIQSGYRAASLPRDRSTVAGFPSTW